jgi:acyl-coenzyme A thioesterase PaaI-like protein
MTPTETATAFLSLLPLAQHTGMTVEAAENGVFRVRLPLTADTGNHMQTMHAALQFAVAEVLGGLVVVTAVPLEDLAKIFGAVKSAEIEYLRPARSHVTAEVQVPPEEIARIRQCVAEGREARFTLAPSLRDAEGRDVARFSGVYVIRPRRER